MILSAGLAAVGPLGCGATDASRDASASDAHDEDAYYDHDIADASMYGDAPPPFDAGNGDSD